MAGVGHSEILDPEGRMTRVDLVPVPTWAAVEDISGTTVDHAEAPVVSSSGPHDLVTTSHGLHEVAPRPTVEKVITPSIHEEVRTGAPAKHVVARAAEEDLLLVPRPTPLSVAHEVIPEPAPQLILPRRRPGSDRRLHDRRDHVVTTRPADHVATVGALELVRARGASDRAACRPVARLSR